MVDERLVIDQLLDVASALKTRVSTRIFGERMLGFDNVSPGLLYRIRGGAADAHTPMRRPRVEFRCTGGATNGEWLDEGAVDTYRVLVDRLRGVAMEVLGAGCAMDCVEVIPGELSVDPETRWPVVVTEWDMGIREN